MNKHLLHPRVYFVQNFVKIGLLLSKGNFFKCLFFTITQLTPILKKSIDHYIRLLNPLYQEVLYVLFGFNNEKDVKVYR